MTGLSYSSKEQYNNKIRYCQGHEVLAANVRCVTVVIQKTTPNGLQNHPMTPLYDAFSPTGHPSERICISASRPQLRVLGRQINNLSAKTGSNKGQLTNLVEAICHQFRERDEEDLKKLNEWQRRVRVRACCSSVRPLLVRSPTNKRRPPNEGWTEKRRLLNETLSRWKRGNNCATYHRYYTD